MNRTIKRVYGLAAGASAAAIILTLGAGTVRALSTEEILNYKGPDRQKMLIEGARKEGKMVIYSSLIVNQMLRPLTEGFKKKYPFLEVKYWRGSSGKTFRKVTAEMRAGQLQADVIEGSGITGRIVKAKIGLPFYTPELAAYPKKYQDPDRLWATTRFRYIGGAYNTKLVAKADVPKKMDDLLNPKWKGKIAWRAGTSSSGQLITITTLLLAWGDQKTEAFLKQFSKQGPVPLHMSNRGVVDRVIEGEYWLAVGASAHHPVISARKGASVGPMLLEPVPALNATISILKGVPRPHAAMLMVDFILSKEGQKLFQKAGYLPAHPEVPAAADLQQIVPAKAGMEEFFVSPAALLKSTKKSKKLAKKYFK
ncbi:MAG: extracellular solute-binding protein [Alphaproteobacteria bacterium]|nr:extracellular solute-binding protein [Alphaproteobacteria bacterium]